MSLNFDASRAPPARCARCGHQRGHHQAKTLACPVGKRTRIGHTLYHLSDKYLASKASTREARQNHPEGS